MVAVIAYFLLFGGSGPVVISCKVDRALIIKFVVVVVVLLLSVFYSVTLYLFPSSYGNPVQLTRR